MTINRRFFLKTFGLAMLASQVPAAAQDNPPPPAILKPPRLKAGDTVGLINPASFLDPEDIDFVKKELAKFGLKVKPAAHVRDRYGYLGGKDVDRAADVNAMFADTSVKALIAMRGGWGGNRILPLLDYELIRRHPKIIIGYSDITSLLLAIYARSGLVTFHGPVGTSSWNPFSVNCFKRILFNGEAMMLRNAPNTGSRGNPQPQVRVTTLSAGRARGQLVGGNLSVLTAMVGSPYLPDWKQKILFVEEIGEEVYRIDRMLTQLKLAGILNQISGFIFGQCTDCDPEEPDKSLTLGQVLSEHIKPLRIPAWYGSMIGHIPNKFTLPVGGEVEIDAGTGTIQLLEPAVG
ncbi:LD-carboxypeptidase [Microcoleus sp. FACHB-68]|uniref:S66 peptidase family protein n=1 Tax=Microcoleus sp. FACHB-68 TaxID=2692826 RepID=UPI00168392D4|nr:LD-carboxypeptidase [Microcoleus sp. FACHB-68]MBD1940299.1 LD-carboxypeptidase [Microcoleus sp. FACHB-68]